MANRRKRKNSHKMNNTCMLTESVRKRFFFHWTMYKYLPEPTNAIWYSHGVFCSTITFYWFVLSELNQHLFALFATLDEYIGIYLYMFMCMRVCVPEWHGAIVVCSFHVTHRSCYANQCAWKWVATAHSKWREKKKNRRNETLWKQNSSTQTIAAYDVSFAYFPSTTDWLLSIQMA